MRECHCNCVYTHYVKGPSDRDNGLVKSLCGKVWKPSKDADLHRKCPECCEILASTESGWLA